MKRAQGRFVEGLEYNQRGQNKGSVDHDTGEILKDPVKGRRIDV